MEKRKKSTSKENKLTVQKSRPLLSLWRSELSLAEFKILDTYLSKINSHKPESRVVTLKKGELEEILGVTRINQPDLELRLRHLMGNVVKIPSETTEDGFMLISLFERAVAERDSYGMWQVKMKCTSDAMKYFFNIENLGYLQYRLRSILSLSSRYTYIMFLYLEANRYRNSWTAPLDELKKILNCDENEAYRGFKYFNDLILKKVQKEMHKKTECRFSYKPIKNGRSVVAIHITVESLPEALPENPGEIPGIVQQRENPELWQEPLESFHFSAEQYEELFSVLVTIPDSELPQSPACYGSIDLMRYHFMDQKAREIMRRDKERPIKNKFSYLLKLLKQAAEGSQE